MVFKSRSALVAIIVAVIILSIGIYSVTKPVVATSDSEGKVTVNIDSYGVKLYTYEGKEVPMSLFQFALYAAGKEVLNCSPHLSYTTSGREIKWDTLRVTIEIYMSLVVTKDGQYVKALIDSQLILNKTIAFRSNKVEKFIDLKQTITPFAGTLANGTTLELSFRFKVYARAYDVYGVLRMTTPALLADAKALTWIAPTLEVSTSQPEESSALEKAYQEGYSRGYSDGYSEGYNDNINGNPYNDEPESIPSSPYTDPELDDAWKDGYYIGYKDGYKRGWNDAEYQTQPIGPTPVPMAIISTQIEPSNIVTITMHMIYSIIAGIVTWIITRRFLG